MGIVENKRKNGGEPMDVGGRENLSGEIGYKWVRENWRTPWSFIF